MAIGRGLLPGGGEQVFLRLEQAGGELRALVSPDGAEWYAVGTARVEVNVVAQVGLYGTGAIDRIACPGAHRDGAAIQFSSFKLWGAPPAK